MRLLRICEHLEQDRQFNAAFSLYWKAYEATIKSACIKALVFRGLDYGVAVGLSKRLNMTRLHDCLRLCLGYNNNMSDDLAFIHQIYRVKTTRNELEHGGIFDVQDDINESVVFMKEYFTYIPIIWRQIKVHLSPHHSLSIIDPYYENSNLKSKIGIYDKVEDLLVEGLRLVPSAVQESTNYPTLKPNSWNFILKTYYGIDQSNNDNEKIKYAVSSG